MKKPESINSLLDGIIARKKWSGKLDLHQVFFFWEEVVGRDIALWARPSIIRGRILWIAVVDSVWMQQLYMQKILLLEKINERLTGPGFNDLRFKVDSNINYYDLDSEEPAEPLKGEPSPEDQKLFRESLDSIPDPQLREAFFNYWCKVKKTGR